MSWRSRIFFVVVFAAFGAFSWSTEPYWSSRVRPASSRRGELARKQVQRDTPGDFAFRAVVGAAAGATAGLLGFTVRDRKRR